MSLLAVVLAILLQTNNTAKPTDSTSAVSQLKRAPIEAEELDARFMKELKAAGRDMEKVTKANEVNSKEGEQLQARYRPLIVANPALPESFAAIVGLRSHLPIDMELLALIRTHHLNHPEFHKLSSTLLQRDSESRQLVLDAAKSHGSRAMRARLCCEIAQMDLIYLVDALKAKPSFEGRLGPQDVLRSRAQEYLNRVITDYSDVKDEKGVLFATLARNQLAGLANAGNLVVGKPAPDITGVDLEGKPLTMTAKSGKVTLIVFWGSWCGPCMTLVPTEIKLAEKYQGKAFAIYGVNGGDERDVALEAAKRKKMTWPSFFSGEERRSGLDVVWNVDAWPKVYVIDHKGVIQYVGHGKGMTEAVDRCMEELKSK